MEGFRAQSRAEGLARKDVLRNAALLATAVWAATPEGARAWTEKATVSPEKIETILEEIQFPNGEELSAAEVTHLVPAENGKYVVHVRVRHEHPFAEMTTEEVQEVITVQREVHKTVEEVVSHRPYTVFYKEGAAPGQVTQLQENRELRNELLQRALPAIDSLGSDFDIETFLEEEAERYQRTTGAVMTPKQKEKYGTLLWGALESRGVPVSDDNQSYLSSVLKQDYQAPDDVWLLGEGGLDLAYYQGHVDEVRGCEDTDLLDSVSLLPEEERNEHIAQINKEREKFVAECLSDELKRLEDPYVVTTLGGAHNLTQEIEEYGDGAGYIVLTPKSYPEESAMYSFD